ncbi:DUF2243 domain-containing protein [Telmatospirillum sp. J64-1]|uniref:DUF2243 domain-containing protein n=1 Tax=Telmatospirillum sp. J64-1 TaxID=2502183 RepID=UPI00115E706C|nr:DUF2243 domain-containing protein [Telmatospirillum sp. J64-1]
MTRLHSMSTIWLRGPLIRAGAMIGLGFGGLADAAVFRHLLQWHRLIPAGGMADGVWLGGFLLVLVIGLGMLWNGMRNPLVSRSNRLLAGSVILGMGLFAATKALLFHHVLQLHNLRPGPDRLVWDMTYLLGAFALLGLGWLLIRRTGWQ